MAVPREQAGLATLAADMLTEGAGTLDALQFADKLGLLGATLTASAGREANEVNLRVLRRGADEAFGMLASVLNAPRLAESDLARRRELMIQGLKQSIEEAPTLGRRVATEWYFPAGDPHGMPTDGYPTTVAALTLAQVRDYHARYHGPAGATLMLAGDLREAEAKALLSKHFGAWKQVAPRVPTRPSVRDGNPSPHPLRILVVDKPDAAQTVIRFVHPGVPFDHERRVGLDVLNTLLGGSFTSRLMANLREKNGWTYGAGSSFVSWAQDGLFVASSNVQSDKTGPAIVEFLAEFKRIRGGDVSKAEGEKARATVVAEIVQGFETLAGVTSSLATYAGYGQTPAAVARDLAAAQACSLAYLNELAATTVAAGRGVLVLVGDRKAIEAQWAVTGLPKPSVITREQALAGDLAR
jgi:zinc protease